MSHQFVFVLLCFVVSLINFVALGVIYVLVNYRTLSVQQKFVYIILQFGASVGLYSLWLFYRTYYFILYFSFQYKQITVFGTLCSVVVRSFNTSLGICCDILQNASTEFIYMYMLFGYSVSSFGLSAQYFTERFGSQFSIKKSLCSLVLRSFNVSQTPIYCRRALLVMIFYRMHFPQFSINKSLRSVTWPLLCLSYS